MALHAEPAILGPCSWAEGLGFWTPAATREGQKPLASATGSGPAARPGSRCREVLALCPACPWAGSHVPNMASVLRASGEQRVQQPPEPVALRTTTSSTVPMPMALPRRPNLLALFPGISKDWQVAEGRGRERASERDRGQERRKEEGQRETRGGRSGRQRGRTGGEKRDGQSREPGSQSTRERGHGDGRVGRNGPRVQSTDREERSKDQDKKCGGGMVQTGGGKK